MFSTNGKVEISVINTARTQRKTGQRVMHENDWVTVEHACVFAVHQVPAPGSGRVARTSGCSLQRGDRQNRCAHHPRCCAHHDRTRSPGETSSKVFSQTLAHLLWETQVILHWPDFWSLWTRGLGRCVSWVVDIEAYSCSFHSQFDIRKIVRDLRRQRQGMIQTKVSARATQSRPGCRP